MLFTAVALALSAVFVVGASATLRDPRRLEALFDDVALPLWLAPPAPIGELVIAVLIVWWPRAGATVGIVYLSTITAWLAIVSMRGIYIEDCACFRKPRAVDATFFVRNGILIAGLATVWITDPSVGTIAAWTATALIVAVPSASWISGRQGEMAEEKDATPSGR